MYTAEYTLRIRYIYFQNMYNENGLLDFPYIFEGSVEKKNLLNHFGFWTVPMWS